MCQKSTKVSSCKKFTFSDGRVDASDTPGVVVVPVGKQNLLDLNLVVSQDLLEVGDVLWLVCVSGVYQQPPVNLKEHLVSAATGKIKGGIWCDDEYSLYLYLLPVPTR